MEAEKDYEALGRYTDAKERMRKFRSLRKHLVIEMDGFLQDILYEHPDNRIVPLNKEKAAALLCKIQETDRCLMLAVDDMEKYAARAGKSVPLRVKPEEPAPDGISEIR